MKTYLLKYTVILVFFLAPAALFAQTISYPANSFSNPAGSTNYLFSAGTSIGTISPGGTSASTFTFGAGTKVIPSGLNNPWGLGIDALGNVYIANYGITAKINGSVTKYNPTSGLANTWADGANAATNIANPQGIAFDQSGNAYVLNYNRTNNGKGNYFGNAQVDVYTNGSSTGTWSSTTIAGLGAASGITNDYNNNLYIANAGNLTASKYNSSGVKAFNVNGQTLTTPVGVAVDNSGNIYVVDNSSRAVYKFSSTGTYQSTPVSGLTNPFGIAIDASGNMYVGDSGADAQFDSPATQAGSVKIYTSAGNYQGVLAGSYLDPRGLVVDQVGNLYVSDFSNGSLTEYAATGGYHLSAVLPPGLSFDSTTGIFSGTPTTKWPKTTYIITAYSGGMPYSATITIQCNAALTITYAPNDIDVFTQSTITNITTLTPIVGGSPTNYSISPTTLTANTGLSFDPATGYISGKPSVLSAAQIYTVTCTDGTNTASTTISIACVQDDYWTGAVNDHWENGGNWSAGVPSGPTVRATIGVRQYSKNKSPDPVVYDNRTVYYLELGALRQPTITVNTGDTLTVASNLTIDNNATPVLTGTGTGAINIGTSATVDVNGTGALTINSPLTFTLLSSPSGSASVSAMSSGVIYGQVSVQRYLAANRFYRLLTSPVNSGTTTPTGVWSLNYLQKSMLITGTSATGGFDKVVTSSGPTLYLYKESYAGVYGSFLTTNWRDITSLKNGTGTTPSYTVDGEASSISLTPGTGLLVFFRGDRSLNPSTSPNQYTPGYPGSSVTLTATGALNQGAITYKNPFTGLSTLSYTKTSPNPGFNLLANPYASTIDLAQVGSRLIAAGINPVVYELDVTQTKNYVYYDAADPFLSTGSQYIVSGQGFFVLATAAGQAVTFQETDKLATKQLTGNALFMSKSPVAVQKPQYLRLYVAKDSLTKTETAICFKQGTTAACNPREDAPFFSGDIMFSSLSSDNKQLMVNKLPLDQKETRIHLFISGYAGTPYTLNVKELVGIPEIYDVWLMDAFKKDSVDLRANQSYAFTTSAAPADTLSWGGHRFTIVIRQNPAKVYKLLTFNATKESAPGRSKGGVLLGWTTQNEQNYTHFTVERSNDSGKTYNVVGGMLSSGAGQYGLEDKSPQTGDNLYRLKSEDFNDSVTYSMVLTIQYHGDGGDDNNVNVYPNPVKNNLSLDVKVQQGNKGRYDVRITNNTGLVVKQALGTDANWQTNVAEFLPGTYIVQVLNHDDHSFVGRTKFVKL